MAILDLIEYPNERGGELVHRIPESGSGEFRLGSQLVVRESQRAVFFRDGKALDVFGMKDNGAVQSCCYGSLFDANSVFDHTVDHVLTKPGLRARRAFVTGDDAGERTPSGLWPSDHGGVVSTLQLRK